MRKIRGRDWLILGIGLIVILLAVFAFVMSAVCR